MLLNPNSYVLRPARFASGNSASTAEATTGVSRDHISSDEMTSLGYDIAPSRPVEPYADMYRAAVLRKPSSSSEEYIIWAASTGSLSTIESSAFVVQGNPSFVTPSAGDLTVTSGIETYTDGTSNLFVRDQGARDLASVESLVLLRGDNGLSVSSVFSSQDPVTGRVTLNPATLTALGGGFSSDRGDSVVSVSYILSSPRFWWSRNDSLMKRFGWNGRQGRWEPLKGSTPQSLGKVSLESLRLRLTTPPTRFSVGEELPGSPSDFDDYALLRVGTSSDATARPLSVLVVSDEDTSGDYPAEGSAHDAVVGDRNGVLVLNPAWAETFAGLNLWYNPESFPVDSTGDLGDLASMPDDSTLGFPSLSPIPGPTERPFIRLGWRRHLSPIAVDQDADLPLPSGVPEGSVYWSRSTGKIVLSDSDIHKAQPGEAQYTRALLNARVYYDGISLSSQPVPLLRPQPLLDSNGNEMVGVEAGGLGVSSLALYIRESSPLPPPGASGVLRVPDGTGVIPNSSVSPQTRPNGSGLIRQIESLGDAFLFTGSRSFQDLKVLEYDVDLTSLQFRVSSTEAEVSRKATSSPIEVAGSSQVQVKRRGITGEALYFIQAQVTPSVYSDEARLYGRVTQPFDLDNSEVLRFALDGSVYTWSASSLAAPVSPSGYTAQEIADSINLVISGSGQALAIRGRVVLEAGDINSGSVEIGWNADVDDLSGNAALGLLPGWRVDTADSEFRWQPDSGVSIGLFRSPDNLDGTGFTADINAVGKFDQEVLAEEIPGSPFFNINNPPLEDLPGYDEGSHFTISLGLNEVRLENYGVSQGVGVKYDWGNSRLIWTESGAISSTPLFTPTTSLQLGHQNVLPETMSSDAMIAVEPSFGLYLKGAEDTVFVELDRNLDYLTPGEGAPGQVQLIDREGSEVISGGGGTFTANSSQFINPDLSPDPSQNTVLQAQLYGLVEVGFLLEILIGDSAGVYVITGKSLGSEAVLTVYPPFPSSGSATPWRIFEAQTLDNYDPTLLADVQYVPFNHLPEEPWKIRLLSSTGEVGGALNAVVAKAIKNRRHVSLRFGLEHPPTAPSATVNYLKSGLDVGVIAPAGLVVPDISDPHFTTSTSGDAHFRLRVGPNEFDTLIGNLEIVASLGTPTPGTVQVAEAGSLEEGEIRFSDSVLSDLAGSRVYFDQLFLDPSDLLAGDSEIDPSTGQVNLSSADLAEHDGETVYFVEQMVTEGNLDVVISPLNGSILFQEPLRGGQIVETAYSPANTDGSVRLGDGGDPVEIVEYLPLVVRLEQATRENGFTYFFNPSERTVSTSVEPFIWVGVELQNFAGRSNVRFSSDGILTFLKEVPSGQPVKLNYGVLEAFGGEQAYTVSTYPVYRPPLFLGSGQNVFRLETDRTADIQVGQLLVVGPSVFYVENVSYDSTSDITSVKIWPPPQNEVGSRAPGRDSATFLSSQPVAIIVDPEGSAVAGGGAEGFLLEIDSGNSVQPTDRGSLEITFSGDLRRFARASHILEIAGYPHQVISSNLSSDGNYTVITVSNPVYTSIAGGEFCRISARPIYENLPSSFEGLSPFLRDQEYGLFLIRDSEPGYRLTEGVDYEVDDRTGSVSFNSPVQGGLNPGEKLYFNYVGLHEIGPVVDRGAILTPLYRAKYLRIVPPSESNRILGSTLSAKYFYNSPDTFYFNIQTMNDYLSEVSDIALAKAAGTSNRPGGPIGAYPGSVVLSKQGGLGLRGNVSDLLDQDRAARAFVEIYNEVVLAFEQILEALNGRLIGDRDGKFRFFVGHGKNYAPSGFEDDITGGIVTRLIWREIIEEWADQSLLAGGYFTEEDPVFNPVTAREINSISRPGDVDGTTPNPWALAFFTSLQKARVKNDMDDRILVGFGRPRGIAALLPLIDVPGLFKRMWEDHAFSRLFPEKTRHFSRLLPGLESTLTSDGFSNPGFYTWGRAVQVDGPEPGETTRQTVSTRGTSIGNIANPALGEISGIVSVSAQDRLPRARIWRFYPEGSSELDAAISAAGGSTVTSRKATFIATPLTLGQFPLDPDTGFPDFSQMRSQGGSLDDITTGNVELSTPGWEVGQRVMYGTPNGPRGTIYDLSDSNGNEIQVNEVALGCIVILGSSGGSPLSGADILSNGTVPLESVVSALGEGDTLFVGKPVSPIVDIPSPNDSPTRAQLEKLAASVPDYRIQFDMRVGSRSGAFIDNSLPVPEDVFPLPLQGIFGQNPPDPLTCIEGEVEFVNTRRRPARLPALLGEARDDSGDEQIPYLMGSRTELSVLSQMNTDIQAVGSDTSLALPVGTQDWGSLYPEEIFFSDGSLYQDSQVGPNRDPATLYTSSDLTPVATAGFYTAGSRIGDVRPFDLLLVESEQPLSGGDLLTGMTGILSVGSVSGGATSKLETPRFVTQTRRGDIHKYTVTNAFANAGVSGSVGVQLDETNPANFLATLDFSSVPSVVLDSDDSSLAGGVLALLPGNALVFNFYDTSTSPVGATLLGSLIIENTLSGSIVYTQDSVGGSGTLTLAGSGVTLLSPRILSIEVTTSLLAALPSLTTGSGGIMGFGISVDTYFDATTDSISAGSLAVGSAVGSSSALIESDRLTFTDRFSLQATLPRGAATNDGSLPLETTLEVYESPLGAAALPSTVNSSLEINGGFPLSFKARTGPDVYGTVPSGTSYVGTFIPGPAGSESGKLRAMAWEGHGNISGPFSTNPVSGIIASAIPSSDLQRSDVILDGSGDVPDLDPMGATLEGTYPFVYNISVANGSVLNVEPGDVLVVSGGAAGSGAAKSGTYLVRSAVEADSTSSDGVSIRSQISSGQNFFAVAGSRGFLDLRFPKVYRSSSGTLQITLSSVQRAHSTSGCVFPSSGYLYLILKEQYSVYDAGYTLDPSSMYRIDYSSVTYDSNAETALFTVTAGSAVDAAGSSISDAEFFAAAKNGIQVSGWVYLPVSPASSLPPNNVYGWDVDSAAVPLTAGYRSITIGNTNPANHGFSVQPGRTWDKAVSPNQIQRLLLDSDSPSAAQLGIRVPEPEDSTEFYSDRSTVIMARRYTAGGQELPIRGVGTHLSVESLDSTGWDDVHFLGSPPTNILSCILPGDRIVLGDGIDPSSAPSGFSAVAGIFLEPSFPRPVTDLNLIASHVVSNSLDLSGFPDQVGLRNLSDYISAPVLSENVTLQVRRIRRFHGESLSSGLESLRFIYEIRRGEFSSYTSVTRTFVAGTGIYGSATNLGGFDSRRVNVNSGDVLRVLDASGSVIDTAEISGVLSSTSLKLRRPGLTASLGSAVSFEIYLSQPIVPHEQSNEQLLSLVTESVVADRRVNYAMSDTEGGYVDSFNILKDNTPGLNWVSLGVREGDYVVVDPSGPLYDPDESGSRPLGDVSVSSRSTYSAGGPSRLDDNRGFYKVVSRTSTEISVDGSSRFSGGSLSGSDDVVLGSLPDDSEYVVLPTIHSSPLTVAGGPFPASNREGQQALRPTAPAVGGSFLSRGSALPDLNGFRSIEPFSYRIIRPSSVFSEDAVELVLFNRERILSWIEELRRYEGTVGGDYYVFQRDDHILDVSGRGVVSNPTADSLGGLTSTFPFANVDDCLSILDRRFWILDERLDEQGYTEFASNDLDQRPVLPDLVEDVLNLEDRFRELRYSWIRFRSDRVDGSMTAAKRAMDSLPDELQRQRDLVSQKKALGD